MGMYKYIKELYKNKTKDFKEYQRQRLISWRKQKVLTKLDKPTNLVKARELGYKAKKGYVVVRARVRRGGKKKPSVHRGRRSKRSGTRARLAKGYQRIAEERVAKIYKNLEVLNSYNIGKDGLHYWYEVILVDPCMKEIIKDKKIKWICSERGRAHRGKTSAGKKGRGLLTKGKGAEKLRPSLRAHNKKGK